MWRNGLRATSPLAMDGDLELMAALGATMFQFGGVGWCALGLLVAQYERETGLQAPRVLGVAMVAVSFMFAFLMPISGFWIGAMVGSVVAWRGDWEKTTSPSQPAVPGWVAPALRSGLLIMLFCGCHSFAASTFPGLQVRAVSVCLCVCVRIRACVCVRDCLRLWLCGVCACCPAACSRRCLRRKRPCGLFDAAGWRFQVLSRMPSYFLRSQRCSSSW